MLTRKVILAISIGIALNTQAIAGGIENHVESVFSTGYFGIGLGPNFLFTKQDTRFFTNTTGSAIPQRVFHVAELGKPGFLFNLHLGYGHVFKKAFYLGGEVFGEWLSNSSKFTYAFFDITNVNPAVVTAGGHRVRMKGDYGFLIRPGMQTGENSLIYLSIGAAFANFRSNSNVSIAQGTNVVLNAFANKHRSSKPGFRVGAGTAIALAKHLAFRLDYFYTTYGRFHPAALFAPLPVGNVSLFSSIKVSTHTVSFNLDYLFK